MAMQGKDYKTAKSCPQNPANRTMHEKNTNQIKRNESLTFSGPFPQHISFYLEASI